VPLRKLINAGLARSDPDIAFLWNAARFSNAELEELVSFHVNGGGESASMYGAACAWLKSDATQSDWRSWLQIKEPCAGRVPAQFWNASTKSCQLDVLSPESAPRLPEANDEDVAPTSLLSVKIAIAVAAAAVLVCLAVLVVSKSH
jgi:hypothetical protein